MNIAFINARPTLNSGCLKYMPFALSVVKLLEREGHSISLFLAEAASNHYQVEFGTGVSVNFLDAPFVWDRPGRINKLLLSNYFRLLTALKSFDLVVSVGQTGNALGGRLASAKDCPSIVMIDEFPDIYTGSAWRAMEAEACRASTLIVVPDESWFPKLCEKVDGLDDTPWAVLPNCPLSEDFAHLDTGDWHKRLGLPSEADIFLQAGGRYPCLQIVESLVTVPQWPEGSILLVNGKPDPHNPWEAMQHLDCPGKIFNNESLFETREFHSLVSSCTACFGLYRNQVDLDRVGKSSGKIMRSLGCGVPVIASNYFSLKFIEEMGLGILVDHPNEIPAAVLTLSENREEFSTRCLQSFGQLSFESHWSRLLEACRELGVRIDQSGG